MGKVVLFTQRLNPRVLQPVLAGLDVRAVANRRELAESILEGNHLLCVLIEQDRMDNEFQRFLGSLKRSFPILKIGLLCPPQEAVLPEGYCRIDPEAGEELLRREVGRFLASITQANRREHHRFDWPLQGFLCLEENDWRRMRIRSLSASGAFLEASPPFPPAGKLALLRILFQDFRLLSTCELLDPRRASSNLPDGFGVRFTDLSEPARHLLDQIVHDALIRTLLEEASSFPLPSISEEAPLTASFELL